jgi:predicted ABC-type ATPase
LKEVVIVAGANGSGKTTFAKDFVKGRNYYFVNADEIGASLELEGQDGFHLKAGRIFFEKIKELARAGESFVMESTLSGIYLTRIIMQLRKQEYGIVIIYVFLENPESCVERVKIRVRKGGHNVPEEDIRRRYFRSKNNFWNDYKLLADRWLLIYNSDEGFQEAAVGVAEKFIIENEGLFEKFIKDIDNGSRKV